MAIKFRNVSFKYNPLDKKVLDDITFDIESNDEFIFIVGQTGSGKSTLVQNMNVLLKPTSGQIFSFNRKIIIKYNTILVLNTKKNRKKYDLPNNKGIFQKYKKPIYAKNLKQIRQNVGLVFQFPEYQLFESTVLKDVMFGPLNFGYTKEEAYRLAVNALKLVKIDESLFDKSPFSLSGGQMRKIAIAGTIACNPKVLILDEPTAGLDPNSKYSLMNELVRIQDETRKSIIIISHDMNLVGAFARRVMVMSKGKLVYDGKKESLFNNNELLKQYNLNLPDISNFAVKLKEAGLIRYNNIPLDKETLKEIILRGEPRE